MFDFRFIYLSSNTFLI